MMKKKNSLVWGIILETKDQMRILLSISASKYSKRTSRFTEATLSEGKCTK